jgi:hypothetical protein
MEKHLLMWLVTSDEVSVILVIKGFRPLFIMHPAWLPDLRFPLVVRRLLLQVSYSESDLFH